MISNWLFIDVSHEEIFDILLLIGKKIYIIIKSIIFRSTYNLKKLQKFNGNV